MEKLRVIHSKESLEKKYTQKPQHENSRSTQYRSSSCIDEINWSMLAELK